MNKQKGYIDESLQVLLGIGLIIAIIALPIYLSSKHTDEAILQAIQAGADPLAAKCAFLSGASNECVIAAVNNGKKQ